MREQKCNWRACEIRMFISTAFSICLKQKAHELEAAEERCGPRGGILVGVDLKKDVKTVEQAYSDRWSIADAFNLNFVPSDRVLQSRIYTIGRGFRLSRGAMCASISAGFIMSTTLTPKAAERACAAQDGLCVALCRQHSLVDFRGIQPLFNCAVGFVP